MKATLASGSVGLRRVSQSSGKRKSSQQVEMMIVHAQRDDFDAVAEQRRDHLAASGVSRRLGKPNLVALHQPPGTRFQPFVSSRRRRMVVVAFDMLAMVPRSPAARIAAEPRAVGVAVDVVPAVPGPHGAIVGERCRRVNERSRVAEMKNPFIAIAIQSRAFRAFKPTDQGLSMSRPGSARRRNLDMRHPLAADPWAWERREESDSGV